MMMVLHPTYTIKLEIQDRLIQQDGMSVTAVPKYHKYFDEPAGKSGCDDVVAAVKAALAKAGISHVTVHLERFEHKG